MLGETSNADKNFLAKAQETIANIIGRRVIASVGSSQTFYAGLSGKVVSASLGIGKPLSDIEVSVQSGKDIIVVPMNNLSLSSTSDCVEASDTMNLSGYIGSEGLYKSEVKCLVVGLVLQEGEKVKALVLMEQKGSLETGDWDTVVAEGFELACNYSDWKQGRAFFANSEQL